LIHIGYKVEVAVKDGSELQGRSSRIEILGWIGNTKNAVLQGPCRIIVKIDLAGAMGIPSFVDQEKAVGVRAGQQGFK
jgi:hypothetical protein